MMPAILRHGDTPNLQTGLLAAYTAEYVADFNYVIYRKYVLADIDYKSAYLFQQRFTSLIFDS